MIKRLFFALAVFLCTATVHARLVDNGGYTTDTTSGLDWLDLTASTNMLMSEALATHSGDGWRHATNSEVEHFFYELFPGYVDATGNQICYDWLHGTCYARQFDHAVRYHELLGNYDPLKSLNGLSGMYFDEDGEARAISANVYSDGRSAVHGTEYGGNYYRYVDEDAYNPLRSASTGTFLVRSTAYVPVPAAVWLFGSALLGLGWLRRR